MVLFSMIYQAVQRPDSQSGAYLRGNYLRASEYHLIFKIIRSENMGVSIE